MAYKVMLEGADLEFNFINIDDALNFTTMAGEYGMIEEYHYTKNEKGEHERVSDGWRPLKVLFGKVEVSANE